MLIAQQGKSVADCGALLTAEFDYMDKTTGHYALDPNMVRKYEERMTILKSYAAEHGMTPAAFDAHLKKRRLKFTELVWNARSYSTTFERHLRVTRRKCDQVRKQLSLQELRF
ncbi:hypothetical protein [uncultured Tateyamaria sp.]|uniref:hypothetical protein n=1 Tax=uncultured Tateyamaria sp. TaxID=455651 RepID=UPI002619D8D7|nr:hypothetical protein [uncultured Tateyamaria sp.]